MRHFLEVTQFSADSFLDLAKRAIEIKNGSEAKTDKLKVVNMFFENSTRTKMSFEVAQSKMNMDIFNFDVSTSSVNKGESLYDSVLTMKALGIDVAVIRHQNNNYYQDLTKMGITLVNGGSGSGEHPSQSLLDIMTIYETFKTVKGLKIAIVGDLLHSRVARSNARMLHQMGAEIYFCSPNKYHDDEFEQYGTYAPIDDIIETVDVLMMLRIQFERHIKEASHTHTEASYLNDYGLNHERYNKLKSEAIIMHPAPVNRDVEIASDLIESDKSRIVSQMANGVYARMAILEWIQGGQDEDTI